MEEIDDFLQTMKSIQTTLNTFFEVESTKRKATIDIIDENVNTNPDYILSILQLISHFTNNHKRSSFFYRRIQIILYHIFNKFPNTFTNHRIFQLFHKNKQILKVMLEYKFLKSDRSVITDIFNYKNENSEEADNYLALYLLENLNESLNKEEKKDLQSKLDSLKDTEAEISELKELISSDDVDEFENYFNENNLTKTKRIKSSIYETCPFLINKDVTLLQYAAFVGSCEIFKFLVDEKNAKLKQIIWLFAVHGNNLDIINFLEEKGVKPSDDMYLKCLKESIKCHHNKLVRYFIRKVNNCDEFVLKKALKYRNFGFIKAEKINNSIFFDICKYNCVFLAKLTQNESEEIVNERKTVFTIFFI